ncbi:hypothetical protein GCM10027614_76670 [Micromonospora vulcania]
MLRKGETSKEVYVIRRLHADAEGATGDDQLGLHFDLTVPFARYVLENAGKLQFPFRRYQIQKVWRGERPQEGRYREFVQADIDIVDRDTLAPHHEAEMPLVIGDALRSLPIPPVVIQVNNRKVNEGFYRGIGLTDPEAALRAVDKLDKIGPDRVAELLVETAGATDTQAKACLALSTLRGSDGSIADAVRAIGVEHPLLDEGSPNSSPWWRPPPSTRPASAWRTCASPAVWTTTPARSTRPSCAGTSGSARSAPAVGTTAWPPPATSRTPEWASRSA